MITLNSLVKLVDMSFLLRYLHLELLTLCCELNQLFLELLIFVDDVGIFTYKLLDLLRHHILFFVNDHTYRKVWQFARLKLLTRFLHRLPLSQHILVSISVRVQGEIVFLKFF